MAEETTTSGIPKWVWIAAIIGVILVLFMAHNKASAASPATIQAAPLDPATAQLEETQAAASVSAFSALTQAVTSIDTNANNNAAALAQTQSNGATLRGLGTLQLKATESNNQTTLAVANVQASASKHNATSATVGGVLTFVASLLAFL